MVQSSNHINFLFLNMTLSSCSPMSSSFIKSQSSTALLGCAGAEDECTADTSTAAPRCCCVKMEI